MTGPKAPHIVVLAAGMGGRMDAALSTVLQPVFFRPMICRVLDAAMAVPHRSIGVVVGPGERELRETLRDYGELQFFPLKAAAGGAAVMFAAAEQLGDRLGGVLVINASVPLVSADSIAGVWARHFEARAACTVGTAVASDPRGLPRVLGPGVEVREIKDDADCTSEERKVHEVPAGVFAFDLRELSVARRAPARADGREPRTEDVVAALAARGLTCLRRRAADADEAIDVGDLEALWRADEVMRARFNRELMRAGVALQDPRAAVIDPRCRIARGVRIEAGVALINSVVEEGVEIESGCRITDSVISRGTRVRQGTRIDGSKVGRDCVIGPYAHLRPGTVLGDEVRIGNFVEVKNASVGPRTKIAHLSYIGDAEIGRGVEIGCGFITCNYDGGPVKQRTIIEDGVFIGSDTQAIAPVRLGAGSFIATGTSITDDVPPDAFVISRGRQVTKAGYARKYGRKKIAPAP